MKIKVKKLGLFLIPFMIAGAMISPLVTGDISVVSTNAESSEVEYINNYSDFQKMINDPTKHYKVSESFVVSDNEEWNWTPIGTKENPFTGTFDGNGFIAPFLKMPSKNYQGFFGYVKGGKVENLKISGIGYNFLEPEQAGDEFFAGGICGYACDGAEILNCEVGEKNEDIERPDSILRFKTTIGGVAGVLTGGDSKIADVVAYDDISIKESLVSYFSIKIAGVVGSLKDSATLQNVANFASINVEYDSASLVEGENYISQIAGEVSGAATSIRNAIAGGKITTNGLTKQKTTLGSVVGNFYEPIPENGNVSNSVYVEGEAYGNSGTYAVIDSNTNDYVSLIPGRCLGTNDFYFSDVYRYTDSLEIQREFKFYSYIPFKSDVWVLNDIDSSLRLQSFQNFSIYITDAINDLLTVTQKPNQIRFKYGSDDARYTISFKQPVDFRYYKITKVLKNGETCDYVYQTLPLSGSQKDDVVLFFNGSEYVLSILSSSATQGEYSFEVSPITYKGSVYINPEIKGGDVKFTVASGKTLDFAKLYSETAAEARAGTLYAFNCWKLYYKTTAEEALDDQGNIKDGYYEFYSNYYKLPSSREDEDNIIYIKDQTTSEDKKAPASLPVAFGRSTSSFVKINNVEVYDYLNQDFLLEAVFEYSPYKLAFVRINSLTIENIEKIVVDENELADNNNVAIVGKADKVSIEIYVKKGYELSEETLKTSLQNNAQEPTINLSEDRTQTGGRVYKLSFYTGKLDPSKMDPNEKNRFEIALLLNEATEENTNSNLGWIIGGSVGGGVLLISGLVVLIWYVRAKKRFNSGLSLSSSSGDKDVKKKKVKDDDYKKYFF